METVGLCSRMATAPLEDTVILPSPALALQLPPSLLAMPVGEKNMHLGGCLGASLCPAQHLIQSFFRLLFPTGLGQCALLICLHQGRLQLKPEYLHVGSFLPFNHAQTSWVDQKHNTRVKH